MERLWAPWRMPYIQGIGKSDACVFCTAPRENRDRDNLILHRGERVFVILNLYPYNNGHLMAVPYEHVSDCSDLDSETVGELWCLVERGKQALEKAFHPEGFNIGMNLGRVAGAGIDQHVHMHVVPRWNGDTNFMPVTGQTKVLSQGLPDTYDALLPYFSPEDPTNG
ncbi:MAG: HIT domain-containing protein [Chitinivibrionales bacterium]|nr:HIT domain-containing protein [Chitinivibrionales bacterium]MBD3395174.1 HIT domain-containing protein [Chitinivibrionales bacterium]